MCEGGATGERGHCLAAGVGPQRFCQAWNGQPGMYFAVGRGFRVVDAGASEALHRCACRLRDDSLDDEMGFRTIEVRERTSC